MEEKVEIPIAIDIHHDELHRSCLRALFPKTDAVRINRVSVEVVICENGYRDDPMTTRINAVRKITRLISMSIWVVLGPYNAVLAMAFGVYTLPTKKMSSPQKVLPSIDVDFNLSSFGWNTTSGGGRASSFFSNHLERPQSVGE